METGNRRSSRRGIIPKLLYFGLTMMVTVIMLLTALVVWLTDLTGSVVASTLILGGFFAVLSFVIYQLSIRDAVEEIRNQIETVYEVTSLVKTGYEWVLEKVALFMNLRGPQNN